MTLVSHRTLDICGFLLFTDGVVMRVRDLRHMADFEAPVGEWIT